MRTAASRLMFSAGLLAGFLWLLATGLPSALAQGCTADPWDSATAYTRGDVVSHQYHEWKAKRNTTAGVAPGTHQPSWQDLGACAGEPPVPPGGGRTPIQIFGVWHAGDHYADWSSAPDMDQFALDNDWIIAGNDGDPAVNLVVLSFLQPMQVLGMNPADPTTGVPAGMTEEVVEYFKAADIRVMMSIGGITYTDYWDQALATNPRLTRLLDYANAMVHRSSGTPDNWQEHVDGMPTYNPVIPPKAPQTFTGGLYLKGDMANCNDFDGSEQRRWADYVETVAPNGAGNTNGMLGYMFWAAGAPSARKNYVPTFPPHGCEDGMGVAAGVFAFPVPMKPLEQW